MLSVALCTYNGETYLSDQLSSILSQSEPIDQIVICDDNSTDISVEIVEDFKIRFPGIIELHVNEASLGPIKNFEKAIGLCKGEIIFLSDQDDVWLLDKVKKIIRKFKANPSLDAVFTNANLIDHNSKLIGKTLFENLDFSTQIQNKWAEGGAFIDILYYRNKITGATLAFKKSLFEKATPFLMLKNYWHDAQLGLHAAVKNKLGWINEPLIEYRVHDKQQVGIGNGTTLIANEKLSSREFLNQLKVFPLNILLIIKDLLIKYPFLDKVNLEKEALGLINWIDLRLQLPKNIFSRTVTVLNHIPEYKKHSNYLIKSIIKDIINPC